MRTRYRAGIGNPFRRRDEVRERATELVETGLGPAEVVALDALAKLKAEARDGEPADPGKLLAHWLDENLWREVLDEQVAKGRQREAKARGKAAAATDDLLSGIYGDTTLPASSVIDSVVRNVASEGAA